MFRGRSDPFSKVEIIPWLRQLIQKLAKFHHELSVAHPSPENLRPGRIQIASGSLVIGAPPTKKGRGHRG